MTNKGDGWETRYCANTKHNRQRCDYKYDIYTSDYDSNTVCPDRKLMINYAFK